MNLIIFDAFNTLITAHPGFRRTFLDGLARVGLGPSLPLLNDLQAASAGIAHVEWSRSRGAYVGWAQETLRLVSKVGRRQGPAFAPRIVPALEQLYQAPMIPMPGAAACLTTLKAGGYQIAVCSNWGWDLEADFRPTGLAGYIDIFAPSAQAGFRKPHHRIYEAVLAESGSCAENAVFIGDSVKADVLGPQQVGIRAIHLTSYPVDGYSGEHASSLMAVAELLAG